MLRRYYLHLEALPFKDRSRYRDRRRLRDPRGLRLAAGLPTAWLALPRDGFAPAGHASVSGGGQQFPAASRRFRRCLPRTAPATRRCRAGARISAASGIALRESNGARLAVAGFGSTIYGVTGQHSNTTFAKGRHLRSLGFRRSHVAGAVAPSRDRYRRDDPHDRECMAPRPRPNADEIG